MSQNDKILDIVRQKGPMLPVEIVKELGGSSQTNTFFVGAILSELVTSKHLKLSHVKVGGSPLYYAQGQEEKLQGYSKYLHEKEQRVYEKLKQEKVLRDRNQNPVERVCLRNIKDFAKPLEVSLKEKELFWKWHMLPNSEAEMIIKSILKEDQTTKQPEKDKPVSQDTQSSQEIPERKQDVPKSHHENREEFIVPEKKEEVSQETKKEETDVQETRKDNKDGRAREEVSQVSVGATSEDSPKEESLKEESAKKEEQSFLSYGESEDPFVRRIKKFFLERNISVLETNINKKNSEAEFRIKVPSAIGKLNYFCIARNKKKCSDSDLSLAYVKAQQKNLPALFICPGELSKKGYEALEKELKTVSFARLS